MAYSTGSYTDCNDALDKAAAWAVTNGWTENMNTLEDTSTRRRVHLYKSINGVDVYSNFKVMLNSTPFRSNNTVYGIALQGSTGYDAGLAWDAQPGFISKAGYSQGGNVDKLISTGGTYHFFATSTNLTCWFSTNSTYLDWRGFIIGTIAGCPFFTATGAALQDDANFVYRSCMLSWLYDTGTFSGIYANSHWYGTNNETGSYYRISNHMPLPREGYSTSGHCPEGSLVYYAPDSIRGNVVMAPIIPRAYISDYTKIMPVGELEGIKMVNTKNHANASEITVSGDTYMLFKQCNDTVDSPIYCGWAFRK